MKLQFFGIIRCCTRNFSRSSLLFIFFVLIPCFVLGNFSSSVSFIVALQKIRFFPVCQSVLAHVHVLVVCALSTVLVGLLVPHLQSIVCNVRCRVNTNLHAACWFFVPCLQSVCLLSCQHHLQRFLRVQCSLSCQHQSCWFFVPRLQSVCLLSCRHRSSALSARPPCCLLVLRSSFAKCMLVVMSTQSE